MKLKTLVLAVTVLSKLNFAQGLAFDPQLQDLEAKLEHKIRTDLTLFFGPTNRLSATVRVIPATLKALTSTESGDTVDLGYLPSPINSDLLNQSSTEALAIQSVDVVLNAAPDVPEELVTDAQELIQGNLKSFNPNVTVIRVGKERQPASDEKTAEDSKPLMSEELVRTLLLLLGAIIAAVAIAFGFRSVGGALSNGALAIERGLGAINANANVSQETPEPELKTQTQLQPQAQAEESQTSAGTGLRSRYNSRNIEIVKQTLNQARAAFQKTLTGDEAELRGIRWILPALDENERQLVKECLGEARVAELGELSESPGSVDHSDWLQRFVERLMVTKIAEGSEVERVLGEKDILRFISARPKVLIHAARTVGNKSAWRIAADFLPKASFESALAEASEAEFQLVVASAEIDEKELRSSAAQMIKILDNPPEEQETDKKVSFLSNRLLQPMVRSILEKGLGEDDQMLEAIASGSPQFGELLRKAVWTPAMLDRVPDEVLKSAVNRIDNDRRFALVFGLPKSQSEKIALVLPEGMVKTMVMDRVEKARRKSDPAQASVIKEICREFLDSLRRRHESGDFTLNGDQAGSTPNELTRASGVNAA